MYFFAVREHIGQWTEKLVPRMLIIDYIFFDCKFSNVRICCFSLFYRIENCILFRMWTFAWIKQDIWRHHFRLWEAVTGIFHHFTTLYATNNKKKNCQINNNGNNGWCAALFLFALWNIILFLTWKMYFGWSHHKRAAAQIKPVIFHVTGLVSLTTRPLRVDVQNVLVSIQTSLMVCVFKLFNGTTLGLWQVIMGTPVCEICYAKEAGEWCSKGPPFGTKSRESAIKRGVK